MFPSTSTIDPTPRSSNISHGARELIFFLGAYVVYNAARWGFTGDLAAARTHAHWVMALERSTGAAVERSVQQALPGRSTWMLSNVYLAAQLVVLPGALIWMYRRDRAVYRTLRATVLATWLISVPIFAAFPVAPPRLADPGMVDTVSRQAGFALTGHSTLFYNPLAAVPSLHVGFAFAIGFAAFAAVGSRWAKGLALAWGPLVTVAVVATGNHYLFDAVAGLVVTVLGYAAARALAGTRVKSVQPALALKSAVA
jgi:hypothetical protein